MPVGECTVVRYRGARRGGYQSVEENRRLADAHRAGHLGLDDEQPPVQAVAPPVLDRRGEGIQAGGFLALDVVEDRSAPQMIRHAVDDILAHDLEKRMTGRHPFEGRVRREERLVECDLGIVDPQPSEPGLQPLANRDQGARNLADAVNVPPLGRRLGVNAGDRCRLDEEVLDHLGDQAPLAGLHRLADDGREVELLLRQPFQGRFGDRPEPCGVHVADDAGLDVRDVGAAGVEIAEQPLQEIAGEDFPHHVEDLIRAQLLANFA